MPWWSGLGGRRGVKTIRKWERRPGKPRAAAVKNPVPGDTCLHGTSNPGLKRVPGPREGDGAWQGLGWQSSPGIVHPEAVRNGAWYTAQHVLRTVSPSLCGTAGAGAPPAPVR